MIATTQCPALSALKFLVHRKHAVGKMLVVVIIIIIASGGFRVRHLIMEVPQWVSGPLCGSLIYRCLVLVPLANPEKHTATCSQEASGQAGAGLG